MVAEAWVRRLADAFWAAAGGPAPFPRDLEAPVLWALTVAVVKLPRLTLAAVRADLAQRKVPGLPALDQPDRGLHGCLVVDGEAGLIYVDAADPPAEQRLSLAHEVAHLLIEDREPRRRIARRLGPDALAAFDRRRPPTTTERTLAALAGLSLTPYVHLLSRGATGEIDQAVIAAAEWRAHRLALELLAPADVVWSHVATGAPRPGPRLVRALAEALIDVFGLPQPIARRYARELAGPDGAPGVQDWLGLA